MEDENLVLSVKDSAKKTGKSKYSGQYKLISNINTRSGVPSYSLAQFVTEYLRTHRPELAHDEIETQGQLEEAILFGSTTRSDGNIDRRAGIRSITARKWLFFSFFLFFSSCFMSIYNSLGYDRPLVSLAYMVSLGSMPLISSISALSCHYSGRDFWVSPS